MNRPPEILVDSGFPTDANGVLESIVIPSSVITCNVPRKVTFLGQTLNYIPSTAAALQEIDCPNINAISSDTYFVGYNNIVTASINSIASLNSLNSNSAGVFRACTGLTTVNMTSLLSIGGVGSSGTNAGHFYGCTGLVNINMPKLQTISSNSYAGNGTCGHFYGCTSLTTVTLPRIQTIGGGGGANKGHFSNCTALTSVQLGSEGHPVTGIGSFTFGNCTQAVLTITIYTTGGAALAGEPWGATNAIIEYEEA